MLEQSTFSYDQNLFRFSNLNKSSLYTIMKLKVQYNNMTLIKKRFMVRIFPEIVTNSCL